MEVLNKKERTSSFFLFLLMFIICTGVLITAIFYNQKIPTKENEVLRAENKRTQYEAAYRKGFMADMRKIDKLLDSLDNLNEGYTFLEKTISSDLVNIRNKIPKDSILDGAGVYENTILTYKRLLDAKRLVKEASGGNEGIIRLTQKNQDNEEEIEDLRRALNLCNTLNRN